MADYFKENWLMVLINCCLFFIIALFIFKPYVDNADASLQIDINNTNNTIKRNIDSLIILTIEQNEILKTFSK
jgi:hypothetical protein